VDEFTAREIASEWHGGQFMPLYAYSSSGTIVDGLDSEIDAALNGPAPAREKQRLRELRAYLQPRLWAHAARNMGREEAEEAAKDAADAWAAGVHQQVLVAIAQRAALPSVAREAMPSWEQVTPRAVFEAVTFLDAHAEATWRIQAYEQVCEQLREAWEEGVNDAFTTALARELQPA
jgi:hypothetical protein